MTFHYYSIYTHLATRGSLPNKFFKYIRMVRNEIIIFDQAIGLFYAKTIRYKGKSCSDQHIRNEIWTHIVRQSLNRLFQFHNITKHVVADLLSAKIIIP